MRTQTDTGSEYGRLLAERDRLITAGVEPADLIVPYSPLGEMGEPLCICDPSTPSWVRCPKCGGIGSRPAALPYDPDPTNGSDTHTEGET